MRFGTSAVARKASNVVALPTAVRVGAVVRTGQDPYVAPGYENGPLPSDQRMRLRPLGSERQTLAPGQVSDFEFTPCEDCYVQNFVLPESLAVSLSVLGIKNCRISYFENGETPGEFWSNQGGNHINRIFFGSFVRANIPIIVTMQNVSAGPLNNVNGTFLVSTSADCGQLGPVPLGVTLPVR